MYDLFINWLANTAGYAAPYALAALGLIISERAGVLNLTAEGIMLVGALAGIASFLLMGGYPIIAIFIAMIMASLVSTLFAFIVVYLRINQVIAGLSMVFFCQGLTSLIGIMFGWKNRAISGLGHIDLWPLSEIPVIGRVFFSQDLVVFLVIPIFLAVNWTLNSSMTGLRLRAVGENPEAADAAGINVSAYRFFAVVAGSALMGLAGAYISVASTKLWIDNMTSGRGWIAIALVIFARWRPWRALFGALLFGSIESAMPRIAAAGIKVPQYFMLMLPYLATLGVMIWVAWKSRGGAADEPGALGQPHVREERR
ncbi:ABC transporter permease [Pseudorhodoplanes sinuspersici]|uniref:ABC transporter permease n=1 Tax=Pseudorhodoplanes sinuspersici TaxID=1235591 RepID=A0A1W6ZZ72_9HYPH|nr:ABC transporter permease [Pseudorhodoplanes sinuspersici]ARQ02620.1 ABC transporter permease [Pseudorhodoplanes sinuspersici]RKE74483.1 nucleoside ABC transporter membrane protein [Pseudorhodoplanes sinuspersici]